MANEFTSEVLQVKLTLDRMVEELNELKVFPSLVWLWVWDVIRNMQDTNPNVTPFNPVQEYVFVGDLDVVFQALWDQVDKTGFTLEYGVEDLDEAIRDWLIDNDFLVALDDDGWFDEEGMLDDVLDNEEETTDADDK